jgi:hypothetical protein
MVVTRRRDVIRRSCRYLVLGFALVETVAAARVCKPDLRTSGLTAYDCYDDRDVGDGLASCRRGRLAND